MKHQINDRSLEQESGLKLMMNQEEIMTPIMTSNLKLQQ